MTLNFTLFAVIDIVGSIPLLVALKKKIGVPHEGKATLISGALMILLLFWVILPAIAVKIFGSNLHELLK